MRPVYSYVGVDWERAFGLSGDSTRINQGDFDGVNLAGIQALDQLTRRQQEEIERLRSENAAQARLIEEMQGRQSSLSAEAAELRARLARLEALLTAPPGS